MPGGLLNLVSYGNQNIMINGNPTKTMFKTTYAKHTNFGLQKFRIDYEGSKTLNMTTSSHFDFKVPRYADLLMDTYLVVQLPHIWSPIIPPTEDTDGSFNSLWRPYEFKWIKNLGTQLIERVRFTVGGQVIQEYTGQYLTNMVERDFDDAKKKLYYNMTGNTAEFNDPANSEKSNNMNQYPNAYYCGPPDTPEPSIRAKKLYIPLNIWFTLSSKMAFPLTALQYNELHIEIDIRPVNELFVIRNIIYDENEELQNKQESSVYGKSLEHIHIYHNNYYHKPNFNNEKEQLHRFIQPPPDISLNYTDKRTDWNNDIHLISTYAFLTEEEAKVFSENSHDYLIKQVYQHDIHNIIGPQRTKIDTNGLVSNFMWYFQRNDVYMRNEWSNYTNWPFNFIPTDIFNPSSEPDDNPNNQSIQSWNGHNGNGSITPAEDGDNTPSGILITGKYVPENELTILKTLGILFDGKYRENPLDEGVFNYVEKYTRTCGNAPEGLYFYNFGIKTNPADIQPTGAVNLSKFKNIEFEYNVMTPNVADNIDITEICDSDGNVLGTYKPLWKLYEYNYNLTIFEERYNILSFMSGNVSLKYSR